MLHEPSHQNLTRVGKAPGMADRLLVMRFQGRAVSSEAKRSSGYSGCHTDAAGLSCPSGARSPADISLIEPGVRRGGVASCVGFEELKILERLQKQYSGAESGQNLPS